MGEPEPEFSSLGVFMAACERIDAVRSKPGVCRASVETFRPEKNQAVFPPVN
jgi:hypothetical protein